MSPPFAAAMAEEKEAFPQGASWALLERNDDDDNVTIVEEEEVDPENGAPTELGDLTEDESPGGIEGVQCT